MGIIKGLINDIKTDCRALKTIATRLRNRESIFSPLQKARLRNEFLTGWGEFFMKKETWMFFTILVLAFFVGYFVSGKIYQNKCNIHIIETYHEDEFERVGNNYVRKMEFPEMEFILSDSFEDYGEEGEIE